MSTSSPAPSPAGGQAAPSDLLQSTDGGTGGAVALQRGSLADPTRTEQSVTTTTDTPWMPLVG